MISKELLGAVLKEEICELNDITLDEDNNIAYYLAQYYPNKHLGVQHISIYELAHKCKEWAYQNGYEIMSTYQFNFASSVVGNLKTLKADAKFSQHTEPEAVFKACQWILDNE